MIQVPDAFLRAEVGFELPAAGGVRGRQRLPAPTPTLAAKAKARIEQIAAEEHLTVLGWRVVPTDDTSLSDLTRSNMPRFEQLFVRRRRQPG